MKKRALSLFLALILCLGLAAPALAAGEVVQSGYCGRNLSWTLTDDGTLTISGTGEMQDTLPSWEWMGRQIVTIVIQEGVTTIGDYAFSGYHALTSVTLPEGLTTVGEGAFNGCDALTDVTIPASVTTIGERAFNDCYNLTDIIVSEDNSAYTAVDGVLFNKDQTTLIQYPLGKTQDTYAVPDGVTTVGDHAFHYCGALTDVTLPKGLITIGDQAFADCDALTDVTFPEGLTTIGSQAFSGCAALTDVTFPAGLTTIDYRAFASCAALTDVTFPEGLTTIGYGAFWGCAALTDMTIPASVTDIDSGTFYNCTNLTSVTLSEGLITIGNEAFRHCTALTDVIFPEGLTTIGDYAFANCTALADVTFPKGLTTIGDSAFSCCSSLTDVTLPEGLTTIGETAFYECDNLNSVTFPEGLTTVGGLIFNYCTALTSVRFFGDAPGTGYCPFEGCTLAAYYPQGNTTWTEEVRAKMSESGNITWILFDAGTSEQETYTVTVAAAQHGKVTASPASGEAGTKVTLTVTPDKGYELDTLTVKQTSGTVVKVTDNTFTMPASNVTVSATFKELSSEEPGKGEMRQSGGKGIAKLTREEMVALLNENPSDTPKDVFVTAPNCTAPYEIGEVKWEVLERVTNRLNALRTLAGLPKVTLDKQL